MEDSPFLQRLREKLAAEDLASGTKQLTVQDAQSFATWWRGTTGQDLDPEDLSIVSLDLAEYRSYLMQRNLRPSTIQRKFYSLRTALRLLDLEGFASLRWPKLPKVVQTAPSGFTRTERLAIIRAATTKLNARDRAVVILLVMTGARASSVASAKLSGLRLGPRSGSIRYQGKGTKELIVPLNVEAREAVSHWLAERPKADHDHLFTSLRYPHDPISRWVVYQIWAVKLASFLPRELASKLGGPHASRHALARLLLSGDEGRWLPVPASDVAALLGHSSVRTTVGITAGQSPENLQVAVDRVAGDYVGNE